MQLLLIGLALCIIAGLSFYAGRLLFQLKQQNARQQRVRTKRIETIIESVQTIALAMQQQQCNLSEGVIRLTHLLEAIPLNPAPDYRQDYPAVFALYDQIKHFPTHNARNSLSKSERRQQDKEREQIESDYESQVLREVDALKQFSIDI